MFLAWLLSVWDEYLFLIFWEYARHFAALDVDLYGVDSLTIRHGDSYGLFVVEGESFHALY